MAVYTLDLDLVRRIRPAVSAVARRTPLLASSWLSELAGGDVLLKCENLQVTGSFKIRGAAARVDRLTEDERRRGVLAASAGNHGQGLALSARRRGVACRIVVPRTIPKVKEEAIRGFGAEVVKAPFDGYDETQDFAIGMAEREGLVWVSPFDDPIVIAGNGGTTALEMLEEAPDLDAIVVPCGGGGLSVGAGVAMKALRPAGRLIGVNTDASPGMWLSRRDGRAYLRVDSKPTIAEGLEGGVSENTYELGRKFIDDVVCVREESIRRGVGEILRRHRMVVEGSAAAGVAAILEGLVRGHRSIGVVLSGSNIDLETLRELIG